MSFLHLLIEGHGGFLLIDWNLFRHPSRTGTGVRGPMFNLGGSATVSGLPSKLCRCQKFQRSRNFCVRCDWLIGLLVPRLFEIVARRIGRAEGRHFTTWGV